MKTFYVAAPGLPRTAGMSWSRSGPKDRPTAIMTPKILRVVSGGDLGSQVEFLPETHENGEATQIVRVTRSCGSVSEVKTLIRPDYPVWHGVIPLISAIQLLQDQ